MMWDGMMGIGMALGLLIGVALLLLLVLGIVWLVRQLRSPSGNLPSSARASARQELERRYAGGEVDRDTYLAMRDDLERR